MAHRNSWFTVLKLGDFPWQAVSLPEGKRPWAMDYTREDQYWIPSGKLT